MADRQRCFEDFQRECAEIDLLEARILAVLAERKGSPEDVIALLEALSKRVSSHIVSEGCGMIHEAASDQWETSERCRLLCADHPALIERLNTVLQLARRAEGTDGWWEELSEKFRTLYVAVEHHELAGRKLFDSIRQNAK